MPDKKNAKPQATSSTPVTPKSPQTQWDNHDYPISLMLAQQPGEWQHPSWHIPQQEKQLVATESYKNRNEEVYDLELDLIIGKEINVLERELSPQEIEENLHLAFQKMYTQIDEAIAQGKAKKRERKPPIIMAPLLTHAEPNEGATPFKWDFWNTPVHKLEEPDVYTDTRKYRNLFKGLPAMPIYDKRIGPTDTYGVTPTPGHSKSTIAPSWLRETEFSIRHPEAALDIGYDEKGAHNISENAERFSTRGTSPKSGPILSENKGSNEGSQINAMRHAIWQATITSKYGADIAREAGYAHEADPGAIKGLDSSALSHKVFNSLHDIDQSIDLANNIIGREIGTASKGKGMRDIALKALDRFYHDGLWTAIKQNDGKFKMAITKITPEQYKEMQEVFHTLDDNGNTPLEQQQIIKERPFEVQKSVSQLPTGL